MEVILISRRPEGFGDPFAHTATTAANSGFSTTPTSHLPSRSHPLTASAEEQLDWLRDSEATSLPSPSSISHNLGVLNDLYECVDGVFQLDVLLQMKECVQDLESSLRRRKGGEFGIANKVGTYMISRKKVNKVICKCLGDLKRKEYTLSALVDKDHDLVAMGKKRISMTEKTDVVLHSLKSQKLCKVMDDALVQNVLQRLEALELSIHEIEQGLECVFKHLIQTRVSLLNILNHLLMSSTFPGNCLI
ncbi:hypothetical protein HHK36_031107 [Tetracentron sinense]|uniref:Uncharacterized protein n=1 Tax=Tetracentron sinense TaxID=13715 RepID=A0A834Y8U7_TETSI|nr:hypothetical protein HHK36_031107 [Tetracentron sinense]